MFELVDANGNRFSLSRQGRGKPIFSSPAFSSTDNTSIGGASRLLVKHLLRYCDSIQLVCAYRHFFSLNQFSASSGSSQQAILSTVTSQEVTVNSAALGYTSLEDKLFSAIASGIIRIQQTHKVVTGPSNQARKGFALASAKLRNGLHAIAQQQRLANTENTWGATSQQDSAASESIKQHYRGFIVRHNSNQSRRAGSSDSAHALSAQQNEVISALGFLPNQISPEQYVKVTESCHILWNNTELQKVLDTFTTAYTKTGTQQNAGSSNQYLASATRLEVAQVLLLAAANERNALKKPTPTQIQQFGAFKKAGQALQNAIDISQQLTQEKLDTGGRMNLSDLASDDADIPANNEPPPALTFIEIELLDHEGEPVANEPYWIRDPEGNEYTGNTDASGMARVDSIVTGICQVSFPERDGGAVQQSSSSGSTQDSSSSQEDANTETDSNSSTTNESNQSQQPEGAEANNEPSASEAEGSEEKSAIPSTAHSESQPAEQEATCGICSASSLVTTCSHNARQANQNGLIQVVPSPNTAKAHEVSLLGVKVTAKTEYGGTDKLKSKLELTGNKRNDCYQLSSRPGEWQPQQETETIVKGAPADETRKWLANASPTIAQIQGKGCSGNPQTTTVECYPNTTYTVEGNLDIFGDWVKKVNKAWEDWGKKVFAISPVELKPKLVGPTGSFSATWGWKEDQNWQAYYDVALGFGLNPIFEASIELSCSMTKLAGTSAGIPPSLSSFAAEHIADIVVFAGAGAKGTLIGSPHAKLYPDGTRKVDGEAKFNVEGKVNLGIRGRMGSDYIVSASLSLSGETKVIGEDVLSINRSGVEVQTTINVEPLTALAKVEVKYLVIFSKTKEKKWTPWEKFELYKSKPQKLIG